MPYPGTIYQISLDHAETYRDTTLKKTTFYNTVSVEKNVFKARTYMLSQIARMLTR